MIMKTDYHIHTNLCDGKDLPEDIVKTAIEKGFGIIGFSGHGYTAFDNSYCMSLKDEAEYFNTITALKNKYKDKIKILCGIEQDYFEPKPMNNYDYVIGSVHYVKVDGEYIPIDESKEVFKALLKDKFGGDFEALAKVYFESVGNLLNEVEADIIGHFDLITKFNEVLNICETEKYLNYAFSALQKLIPFKKPFEINVGAMTRGYKKLPYPSEKILTEINRLGGKIIITGDCHNKEWLGAYFEQAKELAKKCGFKTALYLTENGFEEYCL